MTPFQLDSIGGDWSLSIDCTPDDDNALLVTFRCIENEDVKSNFEQRRVLKKVKNINFDLGIVTDCKAEAKVPSSLDFTQGITIKIAEKN